MGECRREWLAYPEGERMKKIKLEVVVDDELAVETLAFLQKLIMINIRGYNLSMKTLGGRDG